MPPAVGAVLSVGAAIGGAVVGAAAAIGSVVAGLAGAIGGAVVGIASAIGSVVGSAAGGIISTIGGVASTLLSGVGGLASGAVDAVVNLAGSLTTMIGNLSSGLTDAINRITLPITKTIKSTFGVLRTVIDPVATAIMTPIKDTLVIIKGAVDMVMSPVEAILKPVIAARELINSVSTLKVLYDVIEGQAEISELIGAVADGEAGKTAEAIAVLYRDITGTTISMIDKVDSETKMLWASIDSFDERIKTSVDEKMALMKADVMSAVTPRLDTLGVGQEAITRGMARISRHIDDEPWFAWMLLRALR